MDWRPKRRGGQFLNVPPDLSEPPEWWVMPWANMRKSAFADEAARRAKKVDNLHKFLALLTTVRNHGYSWKISGPIRVHLLIRADGEQVAINLDGHHRLAVLSYLIDHGYAADEVYVRPVETVIEETADNPEEMERQGASDTRLIRQSDGVIVPREPSWFDLAFELCNKA